MQKEAQTIYFATELIHPPIDMEGAKRGIQNLYHEMSETSCGYEDINLSKFPPTLTKKDGQTTSSCSFYQDRIKLQEDWAKITIEDFQIKIKEISDKCFRLLGLKFIVIQLCTVRCTFMLSHFKDARVFLAEKACGLEGKINPYFKRPAQMFGMRMLFPPTQHLPYSFDLRIESFNRDTKRVFVEAIGTFFLREPITPANIQEACSNMQTTYSFCVYDVQNFISQFDTRGGGGL